MSQVIYMHELRPGDLIQSSDDMLFVVACVPDELSPDRLRVIYVHSTRDGKIHSHDDLSGIGARAGKFPFVDGRYLYRH